MNMAFPKEDRPMLYASREVMGEIQAGQIAIWTVKHVPLKIEAHPHRRGIHVRLSLLTDVERAWTFERVVEDLPALCMQLGVDENEVIWQTNHRSTSDQRVIRKEACSWTPFLMF